MAEAGTQRALRRARWEAFFAPWALATAGAAISGAYLFQRSLGIRALMFLLFLAAAWLSGKRLSILTALLVSVGIVAANLLVPVGRILARLGPLRITETALLDGIGKALVFEGLVHISKACILPSLRLPGRFGALVASAFLYYDRIVEYKGSVKPATLVRDADALMMRLWETEISQPAREARQVFRPLGFILLAALVAGAYLALLL